MQTLRSPPEMKFFRHREKRPDLMDFHPTIIAHSEINDATFCIGLDLVCLSQSIRRKIRQETDMSADKTMTMRDAIATYVQDGMTVALEGFSHLIPFAAAHEIIRQRRKDLTLCRMTPDIISDQLIAADCVSTLVASFFASGSAGSLYEIRRRIEKHDPVKLNVEEYSHYGWCAATRQARRACRSFLCARMPGATCPP